MHAGVGLETLRTLQEFTCFPSLQTFTVRLLEPSTVALLGSALACRGNYRHDRFPISYILFQCYFLAKMDIRFIVRCILSAA